MKHYGTGTTVVFDGGYDKPSTKDSTHLRRTKFKRGRQVNFTESMTLKMKKDDFLLNKVNKQRFLELLSNEINCGELISKQAPCDVI